MLYSLKEIKNQHAMPVCKSQVKNTSDVGAKQTIPHTIFTVPKVKMWKLYVEAFAQPRDITVAQ